MSGCVERMGEQELLELLREGVAHQADRVWFRVGCAPLAVGHGFVRKLPFRQLAAEDVDTVAEILLREGYVPQCLADDPTDAAHALPLLGELPGEAILDTRLGRDEDGLVVMVEIARPLEFPEEIDFF
jgi:hypothetical protein